MIPMFVDPKRFVANSCIPPPRMWGKISRRMISSFQRISNKATSPKSSLIRIEPSQLILKRTINTDQNWWTGKPPSVCPGFQKVGQGGKLYSLPQISLKSSKEVNTK